MFRIAIAPTCHSISYQNCNANLNDGWLAPTTDLGTFEQNCYFFGQSSTFWWSQSYKQCVDLGGRLAVIETNTEFMWIMQLYAANYSSIGGFFVDATLNRYGASSYMPAWRGGSPLAMGSGIVFYTSGFIWSGCYGNNYYYPEFYLTATGNLQEIYERSQIPTNGGYLCKKFQSAPKPSTIVYNIGYCFPSLPSGGTCPSGWIQYTPNSVPFCYQSQLSGIFGVDEQFRLCHGIGADLEYLDASAEYSWLYNTGLMSNSYSRNDMNAHRFRYGPAFTYSNGQSLTQFTYNGPGSTGWASSQPDDMCNMESCWETTINGWDDISCLIFGGTYPNANGVCKRPLCGIQKSINLLITIITVSIYERCTYLFTHILFKFKVVLVKNIFNSLSKIGTFSLLVMRQVPE